MAIKYIKVPSPVNVKDPVSGELMTTTEPITFKQFVERALINYNPDFCSNYESIKRGMDILNAIETRKGSVVALSDTDHAKLVEAVDNPKFAAPGGQAVKGFGFYHSSVLPQFFVFLTAIKEATDTEPEKE